MSLIPSATDALSQSQNNILINEEIFILSLNILQAIALDLRTATVNSTTITTINTVPVTGSPMTSSDGSSHAYYEVWQGLLTDPIKSNQMTQVINYFTALGYSISRKTSDSINMYWSISW